MKFPECNLQCVDLTNHIHKDGPLDIENRLVNQVGSPDEVKIHQNNDTEETNKLDNLIDKLAIMDQDKISVREKEVNTVKNNIVMEEIVKGQDKSTNTEGCKKEDSDKIFYKGGIIKLTHYIMKSIMQSYNEVYEICVSGDEMLTQQIIDLFQNMAYDFFILQEYFMTNNNKKSELPLPKLRILASVSHSIPIYYSIQGTKCSTDENKDTADELDDTSSKDEKNYEEITEWSNATLKDAKLKLFMYIKTCIVRSCEELYDLCATDSPYLCKEVCALFQKFTYDFIMLYEWFDKKTLYENLPLPTRRSPGSLSYFDTRTVESPSNKFAKCDEAVQASSGSEWDRKEHCSAFNGYPEDEQLSGSYVYPYVYPYEVNNMWDPNFYYPSTNNPQSYDGPYNPNFNPSSQHYASTNLLNYGPNSYQGGLPFPQTYVPVTTIPFSMEVSPNMYTLQTIRHVVRPQFYCPNAQRVTPISVKVHRCQQNQEVKVNTQEEDNSDSHSESSVAKYEILHRNGELKCDNSDDMSSLTGSISDSHFKDDIPFTDGSQNTDEILYINEQKQDEECKNISVNEVDVYPQPAQTMSNVTKQNIFGLPEEECSIHFPALNSNYKRKHKSKASVPLLPKSLELIKSSSDEPASKNKPEVSQRWKERGVSFSEVMKAPNQALEKLPSPEGSCFKNQNTSHASPFLKNEQKEKRGKSLTLGDFLEKKAITKEISTEKEETLKTIPPASSTKKNEMKSSTGSDMNEESDSDGWELVKTRSKWRESSYDLKPRSIPNPRTSKGVPVQAAQKEEASSVLQNENVSNESCSSSQNSYDNKFFHSNESSPVKIHKFERMDATEIYTDYMKYLSNVELAESELEADPAETILHPESDGVNSSNPASLQQMKDFVNNDPVRALDFMNKLADRIRHQEDVKKKNEAKQELAHKNRLQFLHDKTAKFRGMVQKVEEVKAAQHELAIQRKTRLDLKLKKAEEKRKMHLNIIKRKAHDEEEKLKEIAFINELEAQNRRHDSLALRQEHEERLQWIVEERQRRLEEKAAKEAAVEERRKALEAERMEKLKLMKEKRRRKEEFIGRKQQEREQERLEIARERAREREERLQAIQTAQLATVEELQKRIQQKQEESHKRHIECIKLIRQKAVEIGLHRTNSETIIKQERRQSPGNNGHDKYKMYLKKRLKKVKSRMVSRGNNFIEKTHSTMKDLVPKETAIEKLMRRVKSFNFNKTFVWQDKDSEYIDRCLDEILLYLQEEPALCDELKDIKAFIYFDAIISSFNISNHEKLKGPTLRCIIKIITICDLSCLESVEICLYFLLSNILATLLDSLRFAIQAIELPSKSWELIVELLLRFHSLVIDGLNRLPDDLISTIPNFQTHMKDLMSYILCSGLVSKLTGLFQLSSTDEKFSYDSLLVPAILFFKRLLCSWFISDELTKTLKSTDLFGIIPLLYEGLMKHISNNEGLPDYCIPTIKLFMKLAEVDLKLFQEILGAENIALQWRGIASALMSYCVSKNGSFDLLNQVIKLVGYFAIHNKGNQTLLQSGKQPTVLQQLVKLPFMYFCDPVYMRCLFPTLIACSFNNATNRAIVENEVDYKGLEKFMNSEAGKNDDIIKLLLESQPSEGPTE